MLKLFKWIFDRHLSDNLEAYGRIFYPEQEFVGHNKGNYQHNCICSECINTNSRLCYWWFAKVVVLVRQPFLFCIFSITKS